MPERADLDEAHSTAEARQQGGNEATRKRKVQAKEPAKTQAPPTMTVQSDDPEEPDMNTKQWAQQMVQARKGHDLGSTKSNDQRVKTVKQRSALDAPVLSSGSSQAGAEGGDDLSPAASPSFNAGNVSDMLEPVASGPSTLRVTAPSQPQKQKVVRQPKEEVVETKKQRQNRKKVEEQRLDREEEEKARKALEEKQRRAAREARGEPAKNGIPVSKPPTTNSWGGRSSALSDGTSAVPVTNGNQNAPLLDTFDAESTGSSNGGLEASTAATSTTEGGAAQWDQELPPEEDQLAQAMKQSEDESGWTTVAQPKKQKKKTTGGETAVVEPVITNKTNIQTPKPASNGKPKGFQALGDQYEQRTDADPNDASSWDA